MSSIKLPYNENAEKTILGALLLSTKSHELILSSLFDVHFYIPSHKIIYSAILNLYSARKAIDVTTVNEELLNMGKIETIGGITYLMNLCDNVIIEANIEFYVRVLQEKELLRRILETMNAKLDDWEESKITDVGEYLSEVEKDILAVTKERRASGFEKANVILERVKSKAIIEAKKETSINGIRSGFDDLDVITNGFQAGDLIILAARPSMGKTALALNMAYNGIARNNGEGTVAIFSVEMGAEQLMKRVLCSTCRIPSSQLIHSIADTRKSQIIQATINKISDMNLYIDESSSIRLADIQAKARKLKKTHDDLRLIIVDYIGLISPNQGAKGESRNDFIGEISRGLKGLARELNVPVLCLSQLSRLVERRDEKRPMLSDLRDSGAIEQDADIVLFLHRQDYYDKKTANDNQGQNALESIPEAELIIAKHRNGPIGMVKLMFNKEYGLFESAINNASVNARNKS